jgi:hypothetical protein
MWLNRIHLIMLYFSENGHTHCLPLLFFQDPIVSYKKKVLIYMDTTHIWHCGIVCLVIPQSLFQSFVCVFLLLRVAKLFSLLMTCH